VPDGDERLPGGGSRPPRREQVADQPRARLLDAMAEIVAERGLRGTTIVAVTQRAIVSRAMFAQLFGSRERCFVALIGEFMERAGEVIYEAFEREGSWSQRALAGLEALLRFLDAEPALARVGLVESVASPVAMREHGPRLVEQLTTLIESRERELLAVDDRPLTMFAEATVASVAGILHMRMIADKAPPFIGLLGELAAVVVLPYLGHAEAARARAAGDRRSEALARERQSRRADPYAPIPKQLSRPNAHRARAAIRYLAENPGASNQAVAQGVGVSHLGQISRLLARLKHSGLLVKQAGGAGRPNAWKLSPQGEDVARALERRLSWRRAGA
jgi:AcrR family transcriptional regulator